MGVDKSMESFKMGFGQQYGGQLGQSKLGGFGAGSAFGSMAQSQPQGAPGVVAQPQSNAGNFSGQIKNSGEGLDSSMRSSNLLSTPSSSRNLVDDDFEQKP